MFLIEFLANDDGGSIAGSSKIDDFLCRALMINRNATGAGLQDAEVSHTPLRSIVTEEHHTVAGLNSLASQKSSCTGCELTQIGISVLLLASIAFDAHSNASRMSFG